MKNKNKIKIGQQTTSFALVLCAGILQALSLYVFILPSRFSPGGVTGIATAIQFLTNDKINSGYLIIIFNVPLLLAAWFFFRKEYVIKTAIAIGLSSVLLIVLPLFDFFTPKPSGQPIVSAIAGGVLSGLSVGILLRNGGSNGGSEIIGGFIQRKFPEYNIAWFIFGLDSIVVLGTAFVIKSETLDALNVTTLDVIILSIIKMFCTSMVCSSLLEGFSSAIKFEIITRHPDELGKEIISELGRGVTRINAQGAYSGKPNFVLICVVRKRQIGAFQRILKKYPDTFAYIMSTREVYGRGFSVSKTAPAPATDTAADLPMEGAALPVDDAASNVAPDVTAQTTVQNSDDIKGN